MNKFYFLFLLKKQNELIPEITYEIHLNQIEIFWKNQNQFLEQNNFQLIRVCFSFKF